MSWYTTVFPDKEEYNWDKFKDIKEVEDSITRHERVMDRQWGRLTALAATTPCPDKDGGIVKHVEKELGLYWDEYIRAFKIYFRLIVIKEMWDEEIRFKEYVEKHPDGDDYIYYIDDDEFFTMDKSSEEYKRRLKEYRNMWKPSYSVNKFDYGTNPSYGIEETTKHINRIYTELLSMACSKPNDIFPKEYEGSIMNEIVDSMGETREFLDENLFNKEFSELLLKYWDTHKEG